MVGKSQKMRDFTISQPWSDSLFKLHCIIFCMCRKYLSKILKKAKQKKEKQKAIEQFFLIQLFLFLFIFVFLYLSFFLVFWIILVRDQQIYRKNNIYLIGFIHSSVFGL